MEEIRQRFDQDVERFSNLETGQSATIDAPLVLELITAAAAAGNPNATAVLDVGCGAGNYTLKLLERLPDLKVTLVDLSRPMLDRAVSRVTAVTTGAVTPIQADIRDLDWPEASFDIVMAAASLHHLRGEDEWRCVFKRLRHALKTGGSLWIADLVVHDHSAVQQLMWSRYGDYLASLGGEAYRDKVFAYIEKEDTPRSLSFLMEQLKAAGFNTVDVLHKNSCFAALGATVCV